MVLPCIDSTGGLQEAVEVTETCMRIEMALATVLASLRCLLLFWDFSEFHTSMFPDMFHQLSIALKQQLCSCQDGSPGDAKIHSLLAPQGTSGNWLWLCRNEGRCPGGQSYAADNISPEDDANSNPKHKLRSNIFA